MRCARSSSASETSPRGEASSTGSAPPHLGALLAEGGVGERLQRLVQVAQLVGDHGQLLAALLAAVEARELLDEPVEPLEQRLELAVGDVRPLHGYESRSSIVRATRASGPRRARSRSRAPGPASSASIRRAAPRWASAIRASSSGASVNAPRRIPWPWSRRSAAVARAFGRRYTG